MSFNQKSEGRGYAPGWILAEEQCSRETAQIAANHSQVVTLADGSKIVPMGAVIPSNDGNAKGILYEDVEVTTGAMPGSIVTKGAIYEARCPASVKSAAKAVLTGITFKAVPTVTRPDFGPGELEEITVESAAGTAVGDTALTLSGYTPGSGESYIYKVGMDAPVIAYGAIPDYSWTAWDGTSDITAATGKEITVASIGADGRVLAAGSATVTAKSGELEEITVESAAGTASGDTKLTLSGYEPEAGESYVYKVDTDAPTIAYGEVPDFSWTAWDGSSDITATTGKEITVVSIGADGRALAAGSATVTAKS